MEFGTAIRDAIAINASCSLGARVTRFLKSLPQGHCLWGQGMMPFLILAFAPCGKVPALSFQLGATLLHRHRDRRPGRNHDRAVRPVGTNACPRTARRPNFLEAVVMPNPLQGVHRDIREPIQTSWLLWERPHAVNPPKNLLPTQSLPWAQNAAPVLTNRDRDLSFAEIFCLA